MFTIFSKAMTDLTSIIRLFTPSNNSNTADSQRQVLTRLKFISEISPHEKIDSRNLRIESTSIWTPLKRLIFTGDSRETTLHFFTTTIERSCEIIKSNLHSKELKEQIFCANVIKDLIKSVKGLRAVQETYSEDKLIKCEIEVLIEGIVAFIVQIRQTHPDVFTANERCKIQTEEIEMNPKKESAYIPDAKPPPKSLRVSDDEDE